MSSGSDRPQLATHGNLDIYRATYHEVYCKGPIKTHDGIWVRFRRDQFEHIVQESSNRDGVKDTFSLQRASRLLWIGEGLQDPKLRFFAGWDSRRRCHDHHSRVTVMVDDFVVVIRIKSATEADFVTCYVADSPRTKQKLRSAPEWVNPYK